MMIRVLALFVLLSAPLAAQSDNIRFAAPAGLVTDIGFQFVPGLRDRNSGGYGVLARPLLTVALVSGVGKRDLFESFWGAVASEVLSYAWRLALRKEKP